LSITRRTRLLAIGGFSLALFAGGQAAAGAADPVPFEITAAKVTPHRAYFAGTHPATTRVTFHDDANATLDIVISRHGKVVRRYTFSNAVPDHAVAVAWNGRSGSGRLATDGRYAFYAGQHRGRLKRIGSVDFRRYIFPVRAHHWSRGPMGEFGAPRRVLGFHHGFDVMSRCGARIVAARAGRVIARGFNPELYGHWVLVNGRATSHNFFYAHMRGTALVGRGQQVLTGQRIGRVGKTGNAETIGCQLHFEIRINGRAVNPEPSLRYWDSYS
jgi:hypothetical protein